MSDTLLPDPGPSVSALLLRRLAALFYDAVVLVGLLMVATFPYLGLINLLTGAEAAPAGDPWYRVYISLLVFGYVWISWRRSGQTIGMKAWRIKAVAESGGPLSHVQIALRFSIGIPAFLLAGLGYWWVYLTPDGQTLPEQWSGTRTVHIPK